MGYPRRPKDRVCCLFAKSLRTNLFVSLLLLSLRDAPGDEGRPWPPRKHSKWGCEMVDGDFMLCIYKR